jgi:hypothetical protein
MQEIDALHAKTGQNEYCEADVPRAIINGLRVLRRRRIDASFLGSTYQDLKRRR